ncbi:hypothetical protein ACQ4PT_009440 [Festuca glaucescens]
MSSHHEHEEVELVVISDEEEEHHSENVVQGGNEFPLLEPVDDDDDDEAMLPRDSESEVDDDEKYRDFMHMEDLIPVDEDERNLYYASLESFKGLEYPEATPGAIQQRKDDVVFTIDMLMGWEKKESSEKMDEAWAPQKKDEEQQIMWLNKLPPRVKIPLTAQQMAKVAKMDADGNNVRQKQYEEIGRHNYVSTTISQNSSATPAEKYRPRSSSSYEGLFKEIKDDDISDDNKNNHTQIKVVDKHETSRRQSQPHISDIKEACRLQLIKEVYGNQAEMKQHTGSSNSYGIPDKQNDRETHMQPGPTKILKERMFAAANTNSNDSTTSHTKEAYEGYTCT